MEREQRYSSFEDMPVWKLAYEFALYIYKVTNSYPKEEKYGLISDTRRAATSVSANIAEAFGRFHYRDKLNFYYNARGSVTESISHLKVAFGLNFLNKVDLDLAEPMAANIWEELNKIIHTLSNKEP